MSKLRVVDCVMNHISLLIQHHLFDLEGDFNASLEDFLDHLETVGLIEKSNLTWDVISKTDDAINRFYVYLKLPNQAYLTEIMVEVSKDSVDYFEEEK